METTQRPTETTFTKFDGEWVIVGHKNIVKAGCPILVAKKSGERKRVIVGEIFATNGDLVMAEFTDETPRPAPKPRTRTNRQPRRHVDHEDCLSFGRCIHGGRCDHFA